jgi:hypothetical protein
MQPLHKNRKFVNSEATIDTIDFEHHSLLRWMIKDSEEMKKNTAFPYPIFTFPSDPTRLSSPGFLSYSCSATKLLKTHFRALYYHVSIATA